LQSAGEENRIGYFGEQRDKESDYFAMCFRLYDPEIGRFLAIDPLLDIQPSQTPYHYCFNNPTSFTDPTGLYPKKEKGDKVQSWAKQFVRMQDSEAYVEQFMAAPRVNANSDEIDFLSALYRDRADRDFHEMIDRCYGSGGSGGGGSSSGRIGVTVGENGEISINGTSLQAAWDNLPQELKDKVKEELDKYQQKIKEMKSEKKAFEMIIEIHCNDDMTKFGYIIKKLEDQSYETIAENHGYVSNVEDPNFQRIAGGYENANVDYMHIHFHPTGLLIDEHGWLLNNNMYIGKEPPSGSIDFRDDHDGPSDVDRQNATGYRYYYELSKSSSGYRIWGYDRQKNYPLSNPWGR